MTDLDFLKEITSLYSGSGSENELVCFLEKEFSSLGFNTQKDNLGSLVVKNFSEGECDILLDAHIDQIGFVITEVLEGGFLRMAPVGGVDERVASSQPVIVRGKKDYIGVISSVPPHLSDDKKLSKCEDLFIDLGLSESAEISVGDRAYFYAPINVFPSGRIFGGALDDKLAVLTLYKTAKLLGKTDKKVAFLFSSREEVGGQGALTGAFSVSPKYSVAVDVSFGFMPGNEKRECGILGKGPMIGFSPILSEDFSRLAVEVAKKVGIPYQIEVVGGRTGTNADSLSISGRGSKALTVSFPIFNMHTPVESADLIDIDNTAELLSALIEEVK